jgi:hypothetical protein
VARREYKIGERYRDSNNGDVDQFQEWINPPLERGKGVGNSSGIRKIDGQEEGIEFLVFVSNTSSGSKSEDPWEDVINIDEGRIRYWGDAKPKHDEVDDPPGNSWIKEIYSEYYAKEKRSEAPPVLFFEKPESGILEFKGLCIIEDLHIERYRHNGRIVVNYLVDLTVLDTENVKLDWIHDKAKTGSNKHAPEVWKDWAEKGKIDRYSVWKSKIRSKESQKPKGKYKELLDDIREKLDGNKRERGKKLEYLLKYTLEELKSFEKPTLTPDSGDRGVDLEGKIDIFHEMELTEVETSIIFKAQVKNKKGSVGGRELSRLASRVEDGQIGIFFTTSYFTTAAQEENLSTYPVKLISGKELCVMLSQTDLTENYRLNDDIVEEIEEQM